ncbi:uncharacterized protein RCC_02859 [Ramularia collo-cygni]|uniref:Asp/Glu racemase n=1 Tax=Ramularia collo-cygni TaxID=112498 RepID=A0A2D3UXJ9_9PEZI|nr:uncharacterized protein RCC_02859 [Ramularia collo-cygni]CZT17027.1 uncharacterized protein RCC_02859 [Ramularia collo-cygni]
MPASTIADLRTAKKIGFIVPSSNVAVEALTISILHSLNANIIPIFTRIRVLTLGTDPTSISQFSHSAFVTAAQLLADAACDAILWNGTSGMFVGGTTADDRALAEAMSAAAGGIPCSTTTLATIAALDHLAIRDVSIAVPYTPELTAKVEEFFSKEGYVVHEAMCMERTPESNIQIAKCSDDDIRDVIKKSATSGTKAVLVTCTNWPATALVGELERELGIPIIDSIAVTLWQGLQMISYQSGEADSSQWGRLLSSM